MAPLSTMVKEKTEVETGPTCEKINPITRMRKPTPPRPKPPIIIPITTEKELDELKYNGKWAAIITFLTFVYGDVTVARHLPPDERQKDWWMTWSPYPLLAISFVYIMAVTCWGPRYMAKKDPVGGLRPLMIAYNAFQVVFSFWMFIEGGLGGWFFDYKLMCEPCDFSNKPKPIKMMNMGYWYMFSKFVDFIDTVFFVLHKKTSHISLLHVSHHALMPVGLYYGIKFQPGGHGTLMGLLNSFVHTVMYLYYLLAAMGPRVRPYLWWKKYLTTLQMAQFSIVFFHALALNVVDCSTPLPAPLHRWLMGQALIFFGLFTDFYIKAYRNKDKRKQESRAENMNNGLNNGTMNNQDVANVFHLCVPAGFDEVIMRERIRVHN